MNSTESDAKPDEIVDQRQISYIISAILTICSNSEANVMNKNFLIILGAALAAALIATFIAKLLEAEYVAAIGGGVGGAVGGVVAGLLKARSKR